MEIAIINQDKIILLILKIFTKIVTIIEIIMKNLQRIISKLKFLKEYNRIKFIT